MQFQGLRIFLYAVVAVTLVSAGITLAADSGETTMASMFSQTEDLDKGNQPASSDTGSLEAKSTSTVDTQAGLESYYRYDTAEVSGGYSLRFDGNDDRVDVVNDRLAPGRSNFTIMAWFKTSLADNNERIFSQDWLSWELWTGSGNIQASMGNTSERITAAGPNIEDGKWHHATAVYNRESNLKLYLDGKLVDQVDISKYSDVSLQADSVEIGSHGSGRNWEGPIDDVRMYNSSLTPRQIRRINNTLPITRSNLVFHQNFNGGPSSCDLNSTNICLKDSSRNSNTGNPYGFADNKLGTGTGWTRATPINRPSTANFADQGIRTYLYGGNNGLLKNFSYNSSSGWASGHVGEHSLKFDGKDDFVEIPQKGRLQSFNGEEITVTAWVYLNNLNSRYMLTFTGGGWSRKGMYHTITTSGGVRMQIGNGTTEAYVGDGVGNVPTDEWVHVASKWEDGTIYSYVNGEKFRATDYSPGYYSNPNYNLTIGRNIDENGNPENYFQGRIDSVRIYDRALSTKEVEALSQKEAVAQGLVGEWTFESGERNKAYDTSVYSKGVLNSESFNISSYSLSTAVSTRGNFSLNLWMKIPKNVTGSVIRENTVGVYQISVEDSILEATLMGNGTRKELSTRIASNKFNHISLNKYGDKASLYVNGQKEDEVSFKPDIDMASSNAVLGARKILWSENGESCIAKNWEAKDATVSGSQISYAGECSITCQGNGGEDCAEKNSQVYHPNGIVEWYARAPSGNDTRRMEINFGDYGVNEQVAALTFEAHGRFGSSNGSWWNVDSGVPYKSNKWYLFRIDYKDNLSGTSGSYNVTVKDPKTGQIVWNETGLSYTANIQVYDGARWQFHRIDDRAWADNIRWYAEEEFSGVIDEGRFYNRSLSAEESKRLAFQ